VESLDFTGTYTRYFQEELESSGTCGVSFGVVTHSAQLVANVGAAAPGILGDGSAGLAFQHRDYVSGCLSFTPPTVERSVGAYLYQRREIRSWDLSAGLRLDHRAVDPIGGGSNKAGPIRDRAFTGWSGSASAARSIGGGWSWESVVSRSFRAPALEELFSDGPHLAAFAFEVGNSRLGDETGVSAESRLAFEREDLELAVTGFASRIDGFIHAVDTGEIEYGAGEDGFLARWQFRGVDARFLGGEATGELRRGRVHVAATGSYTHGAVSETDEPLPLIPPFTGSLRLGYEWRSFNAESTLRGAARQTRLGPFEDATAAYLVSDLSVEWLHLGGRTLHTVVLELENVADTEYRNHLSRIKSILPEQGRNLSLLYRVSF
jgi:iron complex outermembrane receptor protein